MRVNYYCALLLLDVIYFASAMFASEFFNCSEPPDLANYDTYSCCRTPQIDFAAIHQKCETFIKSIKGEQVSAYPSFRDVCYPECIYRETGALVDGEINMENVKNFLESKVNQRDKDIVPTIISSFQACLANIKAHMQKAGIQSYPKLEPSGCSPYSSIIFSCVNIETFLHCPAQMWKNERYCNLAKGFAEQCNPLPHVI